MCDRRSKRHLGAGFTLLTVLLLPSHFDVTAAYAQQSAGDSADFDARLRGLKELERSEVNPDRLITDYVQLIADFSDHPQVAEAMYSLARYCELCARKSHQPEAHKKASMDWFRQAIDAAEEGSWYWVKAQIGLAGQLRWKPNDDDAVREARSLVEALAANYPDQPLIQMQAKSELVAQCLAEENYVGAEQHCRELLNWQKRHDETALSSVEKNVLRTYQSSTAMYFMQRQILGPGTRKGKERWLEQFSQEFPHHEWLKEPVQRVREDIAKLKDPPPSTASLELLASGGSSIRMIFLACNLIAVIVLGMFVLKNRVFDRYKAAT